MRRFTPYPLEAVRAASTKLDITARISTANGWVNLNSDPYQLEKSSFADSSVSWRKREVTSDYVEGTFIVNAVRENINETVAVWVRGEDHFQLEQNIDKLTAAFSQLSYQISLRLGDGARYFTCSVADYAIARQQEYMHACVALVKATVPRHPQDQFVFATEDEL